MYEFAMEYYSHAMAISMMILPIYFVVKVILWGKKK